MRGGEREASTEGVEVEGNIPKQTGCRLPCFTPLGPCEVLKSDGPLASVLWAPLHHCSLVGGSLHPHSAAH